MAALTRKTVRTCPALLLDAFLACRAVLEELSQEQQMTRPDLPVEDLQVCSGTRTNRVNLDGLTEGHRLGRCRKGSWTRLSGCATGATGPSRARRPRGLGAAATRSGTVVLGRQQPSAQADQRGFGLGSEVSPVTVDRPAPLLGAPHECPIRVDGMRVAGGFE